ncbi:MAG: DUF1848 family protein [Deltaproteobacteria bacterium]|nr:DUF1848 family protein [Deltaproteobacteria bacterium]MBW2019652.1 DUF1848 family protein [Deltaproteobacteria bacterium]MBW2074160.1 DUF1848 family protein [Deltaproteobacteria bacterium]RLB83657.1 MAG: DUF1848 domain-containing protein [Deltaproteobacteria bacterium]
MDQEENIVISASRRTDIPAFYMDWFMAQVKRGYFEVFNPFNHKVSTVRTAPGFVHSFVFWSKNFGPFIKGNYAKKLEKMGYHLAFNFTINSAVPILEPNVPSLKDRFGQLRYLCEHFMPESIQWRFDPICFYRIDRGRLQDNLQHFELIADMAAMCGVKRCITSFMDHYPKIQKRISRLSDFSFHDPPLERKLEIILDMEDKLTRRGISLYTCCEKEILDRLPPQSRVRRSSCITSDLLIKLYGGKVSLETDHGQRVKKGCGCKVSKDIGSYRFHPCFHNCLFCYANPALAQERYKPKGF